MNFSMFYLVIVEFWKLILVDFFSEIYGFWNFLVPDYGGETVFYLIFLYINLIIKFLYIYKYNFFK